MRFLITGGSGYFGGELKRSLLNEDHDCVNLDLHIDYDRHPHLISIQGDVADNKIIEKLFTAYGPFDAVFHVAAQLQLKWHNKKIFYATNVDSTRSIAENCLRFGTKNLIFISSNCVYGKINDINVSEDTELNPFEEYGKTKVASEKILQSYSKKINTIILRPPTIIGEGRLGVLSLIFDFILEGRKLWLIGSGENRYQFIYSQDLIKACKLAVHYQHSGVFNIGCDHVPTLNELFSELISAAKSRSMICHLPRSLTVPLMKFSFKLGFSPLGPYQYNMITNSYIGDTTAIKQELCWQPSQSNIEMMIGNYKYYMNHREKIKSDKTLSGHRKLGRGGIITLIKWVS